jgi:hypothetical protein
MLFAELARDSCLSKPTALTQKAVRQVETARPPLICTLSHVLLEVGKLLTSIDEIGVKAEGVV